MYTCVNSCKPFCIFAYLEYFRSEIANWSERTNRHGQFLELTSRDGAGRGCRIPLIYEGDPLIQNSSFPTTFNTSEKKSFYSTLSKPQARHSVPNICFDAEPKISFKQMKTNTIEKGTALKMSEKRFKRLICAWR